MKSNCYDNRELSWLKFNKRVLQLAGNKNIPLCERMSFAGIFESNLDEFYRVRVGSLYDQTFLKKMKKDNKTGMTAKEQLSYIFAETKTLQKVKDKIYKNLMNEVKNEGVQIITFQDISKEDCRYLEKYYKRSIKPLLSPQVIGKKSPFPFLSNQQIYAVAVLQTKNTEKIGRAHV